MTEHTGAVDGTPDDLMLLEHERVAAARRETLESPLIRGLYDLVFAYESS